MKIAVSIVIAIVLSNLVTSMNGAGIILFSKGNWFFGLLLQFPNYLCVVYAIVRVIDWLTAAPTSNTVIKEN